MNHPGRSPFLSPAEAAIRDLAEDIFSGPQPLDVKERALTSALKHMAESIQLPLDGEQIQTIVELSMERAKAEAILGRSGPVAVIQEMSADEALELSGFTRQLEGLTTGIDRGRLHPAYDVETLEPLGYWSFPDVDGEAIWAPSDRPGNILDGRNPAADEARRQRLRAANEQKRDKVSEIARLTLNNGEPLRPYVETPSGQRVAIGDGWTSFHEEVEAVLETWPDAKFATPADIWEDSPADLAMLADTRLELEASGAIASGRYVDVAALLAGDLEAPKPTRGIRTDGAALFYPGMVNGLVGDSEGGKTLICRAVAAETLFDGGSVLWMDLDHNGARAIVMGLRSFGVSADVLSNPRRFRLVVADEADEVRNAVKDAQLWTPQLAIIDSIGELVPLFGGETNGADDFTLINREVSAKLATAGACVITVDHVSKGHNAGTSGPTGTLAKKRAADGAMYGVSVVRQFTPGSGGRSQLSILKDRHGRVREVSPLGKKEAPAASFELRERDGAIDWKFWAPDGVPQQATPTLSDLETVRGIDPAPTSAKSIITVTGWGTGRATRAWKELLTGDPR